MKVLLAYDGSRHAAAAVDHLLLRPWPEGTEVRVVTVLEEPFALEPPFEVEGTGPAVERIRQARRREARARLLEVMDRLQAAGLKTVTDLREGNPRHELLQAIEEWKPDLVVVGSHGKTGLSRLFMGSVSYALVTGAPCSVYVVKIPRD